jgi:Flp pilus assembly protein TadG
VKPPPAAGLAARIHHDERGIIVRWILRLILMFLILGLIGEEAAQVIFAQVKAHDVAAVAAQAAADSYFHDKDASRAQQAAIEAGREKDPTVNVTSVQILPDGRAVVSTVAVARTLVIERVSFLKHWGVQHASEDESHAT